MKLLVVVLLLAFSACLSDRSDWREQDSSTLHLGRKQEEMVMIIAILFSLCSTFIAVALAHPDSYIQIQEGTRTTPHFMELNRSTIPSACALWKHNGSLADGMSGVRFGCLQRGEGREGTTFCLAEQSVGLKTPPWPHGIPDGIWEVLCNGRVPGGRLEGKRRTPLHHQLLVAHSLYSSAHLKCISTLLNPNIKPESNRNSTFVAPEPVSPRPLPNPEDTPVNS